MEFTRVRFGSVLEWGIATACILAALSLGSVAVREARALRAVTPVIAGERAPIEAPASIPSSAASVPMLLLKDGTRLDVGERAASVTDKLRGWQVGADAIERGPNGDRVTRAYDDGRSRFLLVLESSEPGADPRITGIYLRY